MTLKEYAEMLNDREYGYPQFTKDEIKIAKENGFIIVYGASDDLMEFDGSLYEEAECYDGGKVYFDKAGAGDEDFPGSNCIEAYGKDTNVLGNGWIPCSEKMPPEPTENPEFEYKPLELYLVSLEGTKYPFRAIWNGHDFTNGWSKVDAVAWMPLPEPYQKGE